jgi:hypothetical protein
MSYVGRVNPTQFTNKISYTGRVKINYKLTQHESDMPDTNCKPAQIRIVWRIKKGKNLR